MTHFDMAKSVFSCLVLQCGAPDLPGKLEAVLPQRKCRMTPEHGRCHNPVLYLMPCETPLPSARLGADGNSAELQASLLLLSEVHLNHGLLLRDVMWPSDALSIM